MLEPGYPIPSRINAYLEYNGYSKAKIARRIGVPPNEFYDMLMLRKTMTADTLVRLCVVLGRTAEYFANYKIREKFEAS
ncbi:helix-turn-helix transcriptional regulator [Sporobacter termitidis]|nr:hypothetical protein [Sporobacter termitidis]